MRLERTQSAHARNYWTPVPTSPLPHNLRHQRMLNKRTENRRRRAYYCTVLKASSRRIGATSQPRRRYPPVSLDTGLSPSSRKRALLGLRLIAILPHKSLPPARCTPRTHAHDTSTRAGLTAIQRNNIRQPTPPCSIHIDTAADAPPPTHQPPSSQRRQSGKEHLLHTVPQAAIRSRELLSRFI